jgi:hypothetical protein
MHDGLVDWFAPMLALKCIDGWRGQNPVVNVNVERDRASGQNNRVRRLRLAAHLTKELRDQCLQLLPVAG